MIVLEGKKQVAIIALSIVGFVSIIAGIFAVLFFGFKIGKDKNCKQELKLEKTCINGEIGKFGSDKKAMVLPVYMDYQATTRIDPRVLVEMQNVENNFYGNANSLHKMGREAMEMVEKARKQVADVIGAKENEIIFTSGATESNNLALKGMIETYSKKTGKKHIITSLTEHACILESCKKLEEMDGVEITYLTPKPDGLIDLNELEKAIKPNTLLISIMGVNNEIGVIQDLEAIGKIAKKHEVFFHTDCAQAFGKIPLDVDKMGIDLMSISGHKIYGPKGIGAIFIRHHGKKKIDLSAQMNGGGQEYGIRSGTLAVPLIVGLGKASEIMKDDYKKDLLHIQRLSEKLKAGLREIEGATLNGNETSRYAGNLNFSFAGVNAMDMVLDLSDKVALSIGSACGSSHEAVDSYVIKAIGVDTKTKGGAVRIGIGRFTTDEEVDYAIKTIKDEVLKLRSK